MEARLHAGAARSPLLDPLHSAETRRPQRTRSRDAERPAALKSSVHSHPKKDSVFDIIACMNTDAAAAAPDDTPAPWSCPRAKDLPARWPKPYKHAWCGVHDFIQPVFPLRGNALIGLILILALWLPDQAQDIFIAVGEDLSRNTDRFGATFGGALFASLLIWFTSENILRRFMPELGLCRVERIARVFWPYLLGSLPSLALIGAFVLAYRSVDGSNTALRTKLLLCIGLSVLVPVFAFAIAATLRSAARRDRKRPAPSKRPQAPEEDALTPVARPLWKRAAQWGAGLWTGRADSHDALLLPWGWGLVLAAMTLLFPVLTPEYAVYLGPATVIFYAAATWSFVLNPLLLLLHKVRIPGFTLLLLLALIAGLGDLNDNHAVRSLGNKPVPYIQPTAVQALETWLQEQDGYRKSRADSIAQDQSKPYPVVIIATEGGGIRNAYWTASVLCTLYDTIPELREHVFAISGVSGGSVGAGVVAALLREHEGGDTKLLPIARKILSADLLSPLLARACVPDLAQQFIPWPVKSFDRATALEHTLERSWRETVGSDRLARGFYQLRPPDGKGAVPHLILNTTEVESGERVPVSHFIPYSIAPGSMKTFAQVLEGEIPLSTAMFLSARFPIVTPAGSVPLGDGRKLRFVDGGYFENSATATVQDVIQEIIGRDSDEWPRSRRGPRDDAHFIVARIRYIEEPRDAGRSVHSFGDPASPVRALLKTREARAGFSRDQLDRFLRDAATHKLPVDPFVITFEMRDNKAHLPLGWALSQSARDAMDLQLPDEQGAGGSDDNRRAIEALRQALTRP